MRSLTLIVQIQFQSSLTTQKTDTQPKGVIVFPLSDCVFCPVLQLITYTISWLGGLALLLLAKKYKVLHLGFCVCQIWSVGLKAFL